MNVETRRGSAQRLASALITLLFIFGVAGIVTVSSAPPAAAVSSSTITSEYWWPHNGCTLALDSPAGISFTYACNHHDGCYVLRWSSDRPTCDLWFLNDMKYACYLAPWWQRGVCLSAAYSYYAAVRNFGQYWWDRQIASERINTRMA